MRVYKDKTKIQIRAKTGGMSKSVEENHFVSFNMEFCEGAISLILSLTLTIGH